MARCSRGGCSVHTCTLSRSPTPPVMFLSIQYETPEHLPARLLNMENIGARSLKVSNFLQTHGGERKGKTERIAQGNKDTGIYPRKHTVKLLSYLFAIEDKFACKVGRRGRTL